MCIERINWKKSYMIFKSYIRHKIFCSNDNISFDDYLYFREINRLNRGLWWLR